MVFRRIRPALLSLLTVSLMAVMGGIAPTAAGALAPTAGSVAVPVTAPAPAGVSLAVTPTAAVTHPRLVAIRAAAHPGYDRIVFEFSGGMPTRREVRFVSSLIGDPSGLRIPMVARAVLQVTLFPTDAHTTAGTPTVFRSQAFNLPNVMIIKQAGDFEAVTTYGIGLAKKTSFTTFTLTSPNRLVIDIRSNFTRVTKKVWLFNQKRFIAATEPYFTAVSRSVPAASPAIGVLDRMYAGPTPSEYAAGLRLLTSKATGYNSLAIAAQIARVRLSGGCSSGGSTVSIAGSIAPTLRQFSTVDWVKIYDPAGHTESPTGKVDSIPECLEP